MSDSTGSASAVALQILDESAILAEASTATGLEDFGEPSFRESLTSSAAFARD